MEKENPSQHCGGSFTLSDFSGPGFIHCMRCWIFSSSCGADFLLPLLVEEIRDGILKPRHQITVQIHQLDGIVTGICNEPYEQAKGILFDQVLNMLEGHVDDYVRENAEFHYQAGMEPTIERISTGKCCKWCDSLVGTYKYDKVRNRGNDVFRRHRNCHCLVLYNPKDGSKRRQDVYTKRWTDGEKADRIRFAEANQRDIVHQRLPKSELKNGLPIKGVPDSISDMVDENGKVLQRRKYGEDGRAKVDYDTADHGETWKHPTGAHKHTFDYSTGKPKRSRKDVPFTIEELEENADIIVPGVNYFADKRIH